MTRDSNGTELRLGDVIQCVDRRGEAIGLTVGRRYVIASASDRGITVCNDAGVVMPCLAGMFVRCSVTPDAEISPGTTPKPVVQERRGTYVVVGHTTKAQDKAHALDQAVELSGRYGQEFFVAEIVTSVRVVDVED
jgi:hypothetical protein